LTLEIDTKLKSFLSFNKNQDKNDGPDGRTKAKAKQNSNYCTKGLLTVPFLSLSLMSLITL
jgi:hypothetical protein